MLEHTGSPTHLEEVLKVTGSKGFHLRCVVCKSTDGLFSKWCNKPEPEKSSFHCSALNNNGWDETYLLSNSLIALAEWAVRMRSIWVRGAFHTPSSNSCSRSTVSNEYRSRPGRQAMKVFCSSCDQYPRWLFTGVHLRLLEPVTNLPTSPPHECQRP